MTLRYHKSIDLHVAPAVEQALAVRVLGASKVKGGEVNHVYKVQTNKKTVLVRVFRYKDWPEDGKFQWIEKQFAKHRIPHAKLLFYTRSKKWFPNGFMISEFIDGMPADEAVHSGKLSRTDFQFHVAKLLKKVHGISLKKFGDWHGTYGTDSDILSFALPRITHKFNQLKRTKYYDKGVAAAAVAKVKNLLTPLNDKLKPVLTHGDPGKDNCIWSNDDKLILVDWDNARSSVWVRDYADLMFWETCAAQFQAVPKSQLPNAQKAFLKGYGKMGLTKSELDRVVLVFFIIQVTNLLPYYYFDQKNMKAFHEMRILLKGFLNEEISI